MTDEEATRAGVETLSEREFLERVPVGTYIVTLQAGGTSLSQKVVVRPEGQGVRRVEVRK